MYEKTFPNKRFGHTLEFLKKHVTTSETILDLGVENPFSKIMKQEGFSVSNTKGEDLDVDQSTLQNENYSVTTAFEIFEHLLNPYTVLQNIKSEKLFISIQCVCGFHQLIAVKLICGTDITTNLKTGN